MPRNFRFVGIIFFILGILIGIARFKYGFKPHSLDLKMFAIYSSYLESRYMEIIGNNSGEELTGFLLITGLFFIAFARERIEDDQMNFLRLKAFFISAYLNFSFLLVALLFTFGFAFVYMLMVNMGFFLSIYIISFRILILLRRARSIAQ